MKKAVPRMFLRSRLLIALLAPMVCHAGLDPVEQRIAAAVNHNHARYVALLEETVNIPSATENLTGVRAVGQVYAKELKQLGFQTHWIEMPAEMNRAGHLAATLARGEGPRILLIGHLDTVLENEAYERSGNLAYGSGASDMKGGNAIIIAALRALQDAQVPERGPVTVVFTGDEENPGEPVDAARRALRDAASESDIALAFEGAVPGVAVIGRRGIAMWQLRVEGRQGHSSRIFREEKGHGAIFEATRILWRFHEELPEANLTFNPSLIVGGTDVTLDYASKHGTAAGKTNVIPRDVRAEGDLRFLSAEQYASARERMTRIVSENLPVTSARLSIAEEYPAMAPTDRNRELLSLLSEVSLDLGHGPIAAQDPAERGAGDISFVCDGRPACLDGLGAMGENAHAPREYVELDSLAMLTQRTAILLYRLWRSSGSVNQ